MYYSLIAYGRCVLCMGWFMYNHICFCKNILITTLPIHNFRNFMGGSAPQTPLWWLRRGVSERVRASERVRVSERASVSERVRVSRERVRLSGRVSAKSWDHPRRFLVQQKRPQMRSRECRRDQGCNAQVLCRSLHHLKG